MKKLSMICGITLALALGVRPALAAKFQLDFYDDTQGLYSQGDFETSIDLSEGDTVYADIWVTGIVEGQLVGTIDTKLLWDSSALEVVFIDNSYLFPQANGLWDAAPFALVRPGNMFLEVILFSGGNPGPEIMMHTIEFRSIEAGAGWIRVTGANDEKWFDENSVPIMPYPVECFVTAGSDDDDTSTTTTTSKNPITTTTIFSTKTTTINISSDFNVTTIPKTRIPEDSDSTMETLPGTPTTPKTYTKTTTSTRRKPTTKTKESPDIITEISSKTTTVPHSSPYQVFISPSSITLNSREVVEFREMSVVDGEKVKGTYRWEIIPASTIGSTIDENGLFTAGNNTSAYTIKEIARVTDTLHENSAATVTVTINIKKPSPMGCELSISPSSVTLFPGDTITFSAKNFGERCVEGSYKWKIFSKIDSHISKNGIYTAGNNESGDSAFDIVLVKDAINNIRIDAMVAVLPNGKVAQVAPDNTQNPQQEILPFKIPIIIISVLTILAGIVFLWRIKR